MGILCHYVIVLGFVMSSGEIKYVTTPAVSKEFAERVTRLLNSNPDTVEKHNDRGIQSVIIHDIKEVEPFTCRRSI